MADDHFQEFRHAVDRPDEQIDLGRSALAIALDDYPDLEITAYLSRIEQFAVEVTQRAGAAPELYRNLAALNSVLFRTHGFRGNQENYFDPKNSFLNEVIDRKTGIPITLSVLYMEVANRIGLDLQGVGFPGHFLVKTQDGRREILIDPFSRGDILAEDQLRLLLRRVYSRDVELREEFLAVISKRQILKRMLYNLKGIYLRANDFARAVNIAERIVILDPGNAEDLRDRGVVYDRLECAAQARADFEQYLRLAPNAADAAVIRARVVDLSRKAPLLQ